eukprot:Clim_evm27s99 gene=Clim_evmTU27s99
MGKKRHAKAAAKARAKKPKLDEDIGDISQTQINFARRLVVPQKKARAAAMRKVVEYIQSRPDFKYIDMLKLWKALFYCMWLSDKPLVQEELANNLANIVLELGPPPIVEEDSSDEEEEDEEEEDEDEEEEEDEDEEKEEDDDEEDEEEEEEQENTKAAAAEEATPVVYLNAEDLNLTRFDGSLHQFAALLPRQILYLACFWRTLIREWSKIDRLRLDKFYFLLRAFMRVQFQIITAYGWVEEAVQDIFAILEANVLSDEASKQSLDGPRLAVYEHWWTEVLKGAVAETAPISSKNVYAMLETIGGHLIVTERVIVGERILSGCFERIFDVMETRYDLDSSLASPMRKVSPAAAEETPEMVEAMAIAGDLGAGEIADILEAVASHKATHPAIRKQTFAMRKKFASLADRIDELLLVSTPPQSNRRGVNGAVVDNSDEEEDSEDSESDEESGDGEEEVTPQKGPVTPSPIQSPSPRTKQRAKLRPRTPDAKAVTNNKTVSKTNGLKRAIAPEETTPTLSKKESKKQKHQNSGKKSPKGSTKVSSTGTPSGLSESAKKRVRIQLSKNTAQEYHVHRQMDKSKAVFSPDIKPTKGVLKKTRPVATFGFNKRVKHR